MSTNHNLNDGHKKLQVKVVSFGFKKNDVPDSNLMLDVRFLKNPHWVEDLRPLTGRDARVQKYVMDQSEAQEFLANLRRLVMQFIPAMLEAKTHIVTIAVGCTGGQHRSVAVAEELSHFLADQYPQYHVTIWHRELDVDVVCEPAAAAAGDHRKAEGGHQ